MQTIRVYRGFEVELVISITLKREALCWGKWHGGVSINVSEREAEDMTVHLRQGI